jgi:hypothetical protein
MTTAAADTPEKHVTNVTCDFGGEGGEVVCGGADLGKVATGFEGQDVKGFDELQCMLVDVWLHSEGKDKTYVESLHEVTGLDGLLRMIQCRQYAKSASIVFRDFSPPKSIVVVQKNDFPG